MACNVADDESQDLENKTVAIINLKVKIEKYILLEICESKIL